MKILVAVDETEASTRAAEFVQRFFSTDAFDVRALNVARAPTDFAPPLPYGAVSAWHWPFIGGHDPSFLDKEMKARRRQAQGIVGRQAPEGAETDVAFGDPVETISNAAEAHDADLIVVGSNDKGFLERLLSGSVSEDLARRAPRPVLVVR